MDEQQREEWNQYMIMQRGAAIIEGKQFHQDGYTNMLNKYGTKQDNSTAYTYTPEVMVSDQELSQLYEGNGLFAKIIDRPAEEAVKHGFDINFGDDDISEYVEERLDELGFEDKLATAEKWARLYGGAIIVMLVDDGRGLEEPLDWNNVRSIEELQVFERAVVQPDYTSMYYYGFTNPIKSIKSAREPEYYQVSSIYGAFTVHRSRCLVFRNGKLPELTTNSVYRYWGLPEYIKLKRELRECITSHGNGVRLLERCVQAIHKMKNLEDLLSTDDGENKVLRRLQIIDMARNILNTIAIDAEGEDFDFKNLQMSGVKDILDATCNMLSAVTNIPQTILFGRSPAGMNSTGDSDFENYYSMVENIQKQNMKANSRTVISLVLQQGVLEGRLSEVPKYKVKFAALWSMTESEKAAVDKTKADTEYVKAQTAQLYMDASVLDPSEVRRHLAAGGEYGIEEVVAEEDFELPEDTFDVGTIPESGMLSIQMPEEAERIPMYKKNQSTDSLDEADLEVPAAAVLIIQDGKILCASRRNGEGFCGPGGHIEDDETPEEAAVREAIEEFGIIPINLMPLGEYEASSEEYLDSMVYFTDQFIGTPKADGKEMLNEQWMSMEELRSKQLFPPFEASLDMLMELLNEEKDDIMNSDGGPGSGNWGHGGRKGQRGGSSGKKSSSVKGRSKKEKKSLPMTNIEKAKVTHDINNVYHAKYAGKRNCIIRTCSNEIDSPISIYRFKNHGFDNYDIYMKEADDS